MKRLLHVFIGFLMLLSVVNAQERDSLYFKGIIMEGDSMSALPFAKYEINRGRTFISDDKGQFSFWAEKGDVVSFSYVGYKTVFLQVRDSLIEHNFLIGVFLSKDTIQLSEVVVLPQIYNSKARMERLGFDENTASIVAHQNISDVNELASHPGNGDMDVDLTQRYFLNSNADDVLWQNMIHPDQMIYLSNVKIKELIDRRKYGK